MSRISTLLQQIMSAVYGKDVRQALHDAIQECYTNVDTAKTIADDSATAARSAADDAETRVSSAISAMQTKTNTAIGNCNAATTAANTAASTANAKANAANTAAANADAVAAAIPGQLKDALEDLGLSVQNGKLCVRVEKE